MMEEPTLTEYYKPMEAAEKMNLLPIKPSDYGFSFLFMPTFLNIFSQEVSHRMPPKIGSYKILRTIDGQETLVDLISCKDLYSEEESRAVLNHLQ